MGILKSHFDCGRTNRTGLGAVVALLFCACNSQTYSSGQRDASVHSDGAADQPVLPDAECPIGAERCACTTGGGCDPGLICLSQLCVRPSQPDGPVETGPDASAPDRQSDQPSHADVTSGDLSSDSPSPADAGPGLDAALDSHTVVGLDASSGIDLAILDATGADATPAGQSHYEVRVATNVVPADGYSKIPVQVFGTKPDGTPALDSIVLAVVPFGAATLDTPYLKLGPLGATTNLTPCSSVNVGCAGTFRVELALGSDPTHYIASTGDITLQVPTGIGSATPCLLGGNAMFFDGEGGDWIYNGALSVTQGKWSASGNTSDVTVHVDPSDESQGLWWDLEFASNRLSQPLQTQVYTAAERAPFASTNHPGIDIGGDGRGCNTICGSFQVESIVWSNQTLKSFTATFEQHCECGSSVVRGCVHFEQ
jgi:hypothetical protein